MTHGDAGRRCGGSGEANGRPDPGAAARWNCAVHVADTPEPGAPAFAQCRGVLERALICVKARSQRDL